MESLTVTGRINGQLPFQIDPQGLSCYDGKFRSIPPGGEIQYQTGSNNPNGFSSTLVLKALEDFQYNLLHYIVFSGTL